MNYSTADKALLAIVQTMKMFQHYLRGTKYAVIVKLDHRNLRTSRRPDYQEAKKPDRTTQIFKQTSNGLIMNKDMMTTMEQKDEIDKKIRKLTDTELQKGNDGYKRF